MISFTLDTVPMAQARARHGVVNGRSMTYKSGPQRAAERTLDALLMRHRPNKPLEGPLELEFVASFPVPRSESKKRKEGMLRGKIKHVHKPDLDNLAKQLKDAMTRTGFWKDDRQVVSLFCEKRYGEAGRWEVCVREAAEGRGDMSESPRVQGERADPRLPVVAARRQAPAGSDGSRNGGRGRVLNGEGEGARHEQAKQAGL